MGLINSTVEDVGKRITRSDLSNTKDIYLSLSKKFQDIYITETYNLPATRLIPGGHFVKWRETSKACLYCRYLSKQGKIEIDHKIHLKLNFGVLNVMYLFVALKQDPIVFKITILKHNKS